ncbi:GNAT family N-acetyltransferase [Amnibacterium sp.]|uniref:GNAT family N-acetyltransferase n=1 Tax=Amnibacterium sp. TaxID=1872496 RepID=UPI00260C5174|nr:GNAT family N-acetyltransferase [Amnibacterium sp.]
MTDQGIIVRDVQEDDFAGWAELFRGYREFYRMDPDEEVVSRVWAWLRDPAVEVDGLVAVQDGALVGIAHIRRFHRPSAGTTGLYLDDLFTAPAARGRGAGRALIAELNHRAGTQGLSVVRWITAADNRTARRLYDSVATATPWVTYDLTPTPRGS